MHPFYVNRDTILFSISLGFPATFFFLKGFGQVLAEIISHQGMFICSSFILQDMRSNV